MNCTVCTLDYGAQGMQLAFSHHEIKSTCEKNSVIRFAWKLILPEGFIKNLHGKYKKVLVNIYGLP